MRRPANNVQNSLVANRSAQSAGGQPEVVSVQGGLVQAGRDERVSGGRRDPRRRATILLMVVTLLALLFVIVTGFLSIARTDEQISTELRRGDEQKRAVDAIEELVKSRAIDQLMGDDGRIMGGGVKQTWETIPGYRGANFVASLEPVWDAGYRTSTATNPGVSVTNPRYDWRNDQRVLDAQLQFTPGLLALRQMVWPAVTSLGSGSRVPAARSLVELFPENDRDNDSAVGIDDIRGGVRMGWNDADGDGMPDADMMEAPAAAILANQIAGVAADLPSTDSIAARRFTGGTASQARYSPYAVARSNEIGTATNARWNSDRQWLRFLETARFATGVRVVAHGGMITLDAAKLPSGNDPWNRQFVTNLFDAAASPLDVGDGSPPRSSLARADTFLAAGSDSVLDVFLKDIESSRPTVESALRSRFILPSARRADPSSSTVPPPLAILQGDYKTLTGGWQALNFSETFGVTFDRNTGASQAYQDRAQRVNVFADLAGKNDELNGWTDAATQWPFGANDLNPPVTRAGGAQPETRVRASRRQAVTTVSYSDELARRQQSAEPTWIGTTSTAGDTLAIAESAANLALFRGEPKFYLGEIEKAFAWNGSRWQYNPAPPPGSGPTGLGYGTGDQIVRRLARYYYDMLSSYGDWSPSRNAAGVLNGTPNDEPVSRVEQAFMLAVNTVAFASPRDPDGWIEPVRYTTNSIPAKTYVGQAPQPYLSEVLVYRGLQTDYDSGADEPDPAPADGGLSFAIELYNPHDPYFVGATDIFALNLAQFRIQILTRNGPGDSNPAIGYTGLGLGILGDGRLDGRTFLPLAIEFDEAPGVDNDAPENRYFTETLTEVFGTLPLNIATYGTAGDFPASAAEIVVRLQRASGGGQGPVGVTATSWVTVDQMVIPNPTARDSWRSTFRDTTPSTEFDSRYGVSGGAHASRARWGVASGVEVSNAGGAGSIASGPFDGVITPGAEPDNDNALWDDETLRLGSSLFLQLVAGNRQLVNPDVPGALRFAPIAPLITMNADPRLRISMYGNAFDQRPASFPTVGFMLFLPRFSHLSSGDSYPASTTLERRLEYLTGTAGKGNDQGAPVDFAHIPSLDNYQRLLSEVGTAAPTPFDETGKIPWGLLVFDYFTTLNPGLEGYDPLRVPGRVDINNAPWWVLAELPVLGPNSAGALPIVPAGVVDYRAPAPSFWSQTAGMLVGYHDDELTGLRAARLLRPPAGSGPSAEPRYQFMFDPVNLAVGRYRLGNVPAQSAVAYRDGVQSLPLGIPPVTERPARVNTPPPNLDRFSDAHLRGAEFFGLPTAAIAGRENAMVLARSPARYGSIVVDSSAAAAFGTAGTNRQLARGGTRQPWADIGSPTAAQIAALERVRGQAFGFLSIGELANVKGWDSTNWTEWDANVSNLQRATAGGEYRGDFVRAVSLLALLDSQYLTTRSNTFTIYTSLIDREPGNEGLSIRSQVTIDRSNLLPLVRYANLATGGTNILPAQPVRATTGGPAVLGAGTNSFVPLRVTNDSGRPQVIAQERGSYFNTSQP